MEFTLSLALADFIPVIIYLISTLTIRKAIDKRLVPSMNAVFRLSTGLVFITGFIKASMKVAFIAEHHSTIIDTVQSMLDTYYFPTLVTLYYISGLSVLFSLMINTKKPIRIIVYTLFSLILVKNIICYTDVEKSKMFFVLILSLGNLILWGSLSFLSFKCKIPSSGVLYIITFILLMGMGYMNTKDFSNAATHWATESLNIVAHIFMLLASVTLRKKSNGHLK